MYKIIDFVVIKFKILEEMAVIRRKLITDRLEGGGFKMMLAESPTEWICSS